MSSAAEDEVGTVHHNGKVAIPIRTSMIELGYKQGPTPINTTNSPFDVFFNKTIKPKRSKAFAMKFY